MKGDILQIECQLPARLQNQVDTYPILSLSDLKYLTDFGLDEKSWIDIYIDGNFKSLWPDVLIFLPSR